MIITQTDFQKLSNYFLSTKNFKVLKRLTEECLTYTGYIYIYIYNLPQEGWRKWS